MNDQILVWGSNEHNQCLGLNEKIVSSLDGCNSKYGINHKIISVASGSSHCLVLTDQADVYGWGNNNMGQIGIDKKSFNYPQKINFQHKCSKNDGDNEIKIQKISAGGMFSVFITNCGCIIKKGSIFGDISQSVDVSMPNTMASVTEVSCGVSHVMLLLSSGHVACFGRNMYGQIGVPRKDLDKNIETVSTPRIVTEGFLHRITMIAAGSYHSLCCDAINQLFCWGYGLPCGIVTGHVMQPSYLPGLDQPIRRMAAGSSHSFFLTESRFLYVIGGNDFKQAAPCCDLKYILNLTRVDYFTESLEDVFCGDNYSMVKTDGGDVYMWGKNCLLIDPTLPISFCFTTPQRVLSKELISGCKIMSMSCGSWHVLCHVVSTVQGKELLDNLSDEEDDYNQWEKDAEQDQVSNCCTSEESPSEILSNCSKIEKNKLSSTMNRERTYTTLRELYSKTPNQPRNNPKFDNPIETLPNSNQKNEYYKHFSKIRTKEVDDYSKFLSTKCISQQQGRTARHDKQTFVNNDVHLPSPMQYGSKPSEPIYESVDFDQTAPSSRSRDISCLENRLFHLPGILNVREYRKTPGEKLRRVPFQKSKTEFMSSSKYCFVTKKSAQEIYQSLNVTHKLDLHLQEDFTVCPQRSFISKGKMKTSLGKNKTISSHVKWLNSK